MKYLISTIFLILFHFTGKSQVPNIVWQKAFGGSVNDVANSVAQTPDGGYVIAGKTASTQGNITASYGNDDLWIVKTDGSGNLQWQKSYGGSGDDSAKSVITTSDGGYMVLGSTTSTNGHITQNRGSSDYWMIKLDAGGNMQWQKTYGGPGNDQGNSVNKTSDGGYILAGYSNSSSGDITSPRGDNDFWVVKTDSSGNIIWQKSLGGDQNDKAWEINQTHDGGYIVAGDSNSSQGDLSTISYGLADYWVVKLSSTGNLVWEKRFGGSANEFAYSLIPTFDNGYIVTGESFSQNGQISSSNGGGDYWVIKLDALGNLQWEKSIGGPSYNSAKSIIQTTDGEYLIAGSSISPNTVPPGNHGLIDYWVVKISQTGNLLWHKHLGGDESDSAQQIIQTSDGGAVIVGEANSFNSGQVSGSYGLKDFWMVKLDYVLGTDETEVKSNISIYPNPAKDIIYLKNLPLKTEISILDISGKLIFSKNYADSEVAVSLSGLMSGSYIVQVQHSGKIILSEKLLIVK